LWPNTDEQSMIGGPSVEKLQSGKEVGAKNVTGRWETGKGEIEGYRGTAIRSPVPLTVGQKVRASRRQGGEADFGVRGRGPQ